MLIATLKRDLLLVYRSPADLMNPLVFFVIVVSLFPMGISPSASVLVEIAPGILWVAALLATLLSFENVFRSDFEDGSLEQMAVSTKPFILIVLGKVIGHWLVSGMPLILVSPLLGVMLFLPAEGIQALVISLLLGTPILSLVGTIGAGLTVGLRRSGLLLTILILPLYVPVLILGTTLVKTGIQGGDYTGHMLWLGVLLTLGLALAPLATTAGLRISLSH